MQRFMVYEDCEIVQVSAVDFDGLRLFEQHVSLNGSIRFQSKKFTGVTKLFCHGQLVDAVEVNVGLNRFGLRLKELCGMVVLGDHNVWAFDVKHFFDNVKKKDIWRICLALVQQVLLIRSHYLEIFFQKKIPIHKKNYMWKLSVKPMQLIT